MDDVNQKRRIRVLVAGTLVGYLVLVPYVVMNAMRASAHSSVGRVLFSWPALLLVTVLYQAFPFSWAYAILRHRLFDVRVILRQGLQYALARRVLLTVVPALGVVLLADLLLHGQRPLLEILRTRGWIYIVLGGLAAAAYIKRQSWLQALDRRFFRERYDAHRLLREVVEEVREARGFGQWRCKRSRTSRPRSTPKLVASCGRDASRFFQQQRQAGGDGDQQIQVLTRVGPPPSASIPGPEVPQCGPSQSRWAPAIQSVCSANRLRSHRPQLAG